MAAKLFAATSVGTTVLIGRTGVAASQQAELAQEDAVSEDKAVRFEL